MNDDCKCDDPCAGGCGCHVPGSNSGVPDLETGQMDAAGGESPQNLPPRDDQTIQLTVQIRIDEHGHVQSLHDFQTPEDSEISRQWEGGGVRHIAHALLTEAVRREVFVCALLAMTQDSELLSSYKNPEKQEAVVADLAAKAERNLADVVPKLSQGCVQEVLEMMLQAH